MTPPAAPSTRPAELDRRFYAYAFDRLVAWGAAIALGVGLWVATDGENRLLAVGCALGLLAACWLVLAISTGAAGVTPGKALCGLRVVKNDGAGPPGVGSALLRQLVLGISGVPTFGFGGAALAWTAAADDSGDRRGWHDALAGTRVVDVRPVRIDEAADGEQGPRHVVNLTAMRLIPAPAVRAPMSAVTDRDSEHSMRRQPLPKDLTRPSNPSAPLPDLPAPAAPRHAASAPPASIPPAPTPPAPVQPAPPAPVQPAPAHTAHAHPAPAQPAHRAPAHPAPVPPPPAHRASAAAGSAGWGASSPSHSAPPAAQPAPSPAAAWQPPAPATRWRATFDDGQSFVVEGLVLVGRRPEPRPGEQVHHLVPLRSPEMSVSKTHAQFGPAADGVIVVVDRGSTNGTVLIRQGAGRQLTAGKATTLRDGDKVMFGDRAMSLTREP